MRRGPGVLLFLGSVGVAALGAVAACGGSDGTAEAIPKEAGSIIEPDGDSLPDVQPPPPAPPSTPSALRPPLAKGDPCRGVPIPSDQHYVAAGMCARVVATGLEYGRQITFAPNGDLFMQNTLGAVYKLHDGDDDGFFQANEIVLYGETKPTELNGNNCHVDVVGGFLYCGSEGGVMRFTYSPNATSGGAPQPVITGTPQGGHRKRTVHVYDGYIYLNSGSADNASHEGGPGQTDYDTARAVLKRFPVSSFKGTPLDWSTGEVVTTGLRNMNGFTRTASGRMYGVVNGYDDEVYQGVDVHNDNPGEQVVPLAMGNRFGFPFCFTAQRVVTGTTNVVTPGTQLASIGPRLYPQNPHDDAWCAANSMQPATFVQAHSAPLDIVFFDAPDPRGVLPERYRGGAFVALHGSWDRDTSTGNKVIWIPFDAEGKAPMPTSTATTTTFPYETVFGGGDTTGPKDGTWSWQFPGGAYFDAEVRPAGVAISPIDGALYIMTDQWGNLYRVGLHPARHSPQK